jgi:hypothetical protein
MHHKRNIRSYVKYLPLYGCVSTGLIYLGIGVVAILSFLRIKHGGADESSLLAYLNEYPIGKIGFWSILLGTLCYVVWRIFESINDPYAYGRELNGIARRTGIAATTIPDALIAVTCIQIIMGKGNIQLDGRPVELRAMVGSLLEKPWGNSVVIAIGVIICLTALVQFFYGVTQGYKERLDIAHFTKQMKAITHLLAGIGYLARGVIVGIIGLFFMKSGILHSPEYIVNTDKAFDYIGDNIGHFYFILIAIGTICYGVFMFIQGFSYDVDKD